jgi:hypothetical protein
VKVWDYKTVRYLKGYRTVYDYERVRVWRGGRWVQEIREVPSRRVPIYGRKRVRAGWHWETRREPRWVTEQVQIDTRLEERTIERWGWAQEKVGERTVYESVPRYVDRRVRQGEEERWVLEKIPPPPPPVPATVPASHAGNKPPSVPQPPGLGASDDGATKPYPFFAPRPESGSELSPEQASTITRGLGLAAKYIRKLKKINSVAPLQFSLLDGEYASVKVSEAIPRGSKVPFRRSLGFAGTRYSWLTASRIKAAQIWKAGRSNSALGFALGLSVVQNVVDFGWGANKEKGFGKEFMASTMVDFAKAGLVGLASAGMVAGGIALAGAVGIAAAAAAPLWLVMGVTALLGVGLGIVADRLIEKHQIKERVAEGFTAWKGIAQNAGTIVNVGVQRLSEVANRKTAEIGQRVHQAGEAAAGWAQSTQDELHRGLQQVGKRASDLIQDAQSTVQALGAEAKQAAGTLVDSVSSVFKGLFGGGK